MVRGTFGPGKRSTRCLCLEAPNRDACHDQLVGGTQRGREGHGVKPGERPLGLIETADQEEAADLGYRACAAFTRSPCASSVARAASSVFAGQFRSLEASAISASATTHLARATASFGPNSARGTSHESLCSNKVAKLRHRDASKRECGRVVAQGDPVQRAERVARGERMRRDRN